MIMPYVTHPICLEKCEIYAISEFNVIARFRKTISTMKFVSSFEIYKISRFFTEITVLPFLIKIEFSQVLQSQSSIRA